MEIQSQFIKSEILFWREACEVLDHGDHLSVKCHTNPNWRWGNLLILSAPPSPGDLERWNAAFENAFPEGRPHRMFVWDDPQGNDGDLREFFAAGYRLQHDPLLSATELIRPLPVAIDVQFREIATADEWEQVIVANAASFGPNIPNYEHFVRGLLSIHQSLVAQGKGLWLCAYVNGALAGSCGIFDSGEFCRYQEVSVLEQYRNSGIASNLVFKAAQLAKERGFPSLLFIVADPDTQAERIYRRLGFSKIETTSSLRRLPEDNIITDKKAEAT